MEKPNILNEEVRVVVNEIAEVAGYLWERGWAERNAGNISVNISELLAGHDTENHFFRASVPRKFFPGIPEGIRGQTFVLTLTGSRMREVSRDPEANLCLIHIDHSGDSFYQVGLDVRASGQSPTSELPAHLAIHELLLRKKPGVKAVVHTHAAELIALTQIREYHSAEALNRLIWGMHPETLMFIPQGIGYVPYILPGTENIARATLSELETHPVVAWEKHGVISTGRNVLEAFDYIDLVSKSARIFFLCRNAGFVPEGLTEDQLREIRDNYISS